MFLASVIGFSFDLETLLQIYPFENEQKKFIQDELDALQTLGLVHPENSSSSLSFTFESQQLLEVAYSRLTFAQRIELHENIIAWYKSLPVDIHRTEKIAYHLVTVIENSKDVSEEVILSAIHHLERAGGVAALAYGTEIARVWREKALSLALTLPASDVKTAYVEKFNHLLQISPSDIPSSDSPLKITLRELSGVGGPSHHLS